MSRISLWCDNCAKWVTLMPADELCPCCGKFQYLTDNEPHDTRGLQEYFDADFDCISDADPGL